VRDTEYRYGRLQQIYRYQKQLEIMQLATIAILASRVADVRALTGIYRQQTAG